MYCVRDPLKRLIGICLIVLGTILVLCFLPGWLWCAFIGIAMIIVGIVILIGNRYC